MRENAPYLLLMMVVLIGWTLRRAAGRLAPRAAIGPLIFLATRWPILLVAALGTLGWFGTLLTGAIAHGHTGTSDLLLMAGLSVWLGFGVAAIVVAPIWAITRAFGPRPTFPLETDEQLLREVTANHFLGGESRGGKLIITTRRLGFRPHRFNAQLDTWSTSLEDIATLSCEGERFLVVTEKNSLAPQWIVLMQPSLMKETIQRLRQAPESTRTSLAI